jgi:hypothetical protein
MSDDSGPIEWTQESSDNLGKIAEDAVRAAQLTPGQWVNPMDSYLKSKVRYARTPAEIQNFLLENGRPISMDDIEDFAQECADGFFQHYSPRRSFLAGDTDASNIARALKHDWYDEIRSLDDRALYRDVLRFIKRLGGLETNKIREIQSWRSFTEPTSIPGFKRFYSADRRFPISAVYPEEFDFFYDFNREAYLHLDWTGRGDKGFGISREHLGMSAQRGDDQARLVLLGKKDLPIFIQESFAQRRAEARAIGIGGSTPKSKLEDAIIGEGTHAFRAKRLVWYTREGDYEGEWSFFVRARLSGLWKTFVSKVDARVQQPMLWLFRNSVLDQATFNTVLSSIRWLDEEFFRSLPTQPYG